jgi:hypothetical protein
MSLRPCAEAGCATGIAVISAMARAAQRSVVRNENFAVIDYDGRATVTLSLLA